MPNRVLIGLLKLTFKAILFFDGKKGYPLSCERIKDILIVNIAACDLIFIYGSHTLSYIANDTEKAFRMLKPGGLILLHDYRRGSEPRDVEVFQNQLRATGKLCHIAGTSLVVYRHE